MRITLDTTQAAKQLSQEAAAQGATATANAAGATVQASIEGGKAVAEIAAGTAAGGPWGAILSAAWSMRHTLFKVLICICLFLLIIVTLICSIPSIVLDSVFGLNAYQWLGGILGVSGRDAHIGQLSTLSCNLVIQESKKQVAWYRKRSLEKAKTEGDVQA